jgi:cytochrome c oxidase subunit 3
MSSTPLSHLKHPYHLVDPSPWPLLGSLGALTMAFGMVKYMHYYHGGFAVLAFGFTVTAYTMYVWWRDIVREGTFEGRHTLKVQKGLRLGIILFIVSEVMFFFSFFWAFFHSSLGPSIQIGQMWPPMGIAVMNPWGVPLLNTVILLSSGATVTWAHHAVVAGEKKHAVYGLVLTIILAALFTGFQVLEYLEASFTISDSVYGSAFYMATGFHGFHVLVGSIFLFVCLIRLMRDHFTRTHHIGLEGAIWYWHFVDVVWLFLFVTIYWWGGN